MTGVARPRRQDRRRPHHRQRQSALANRTSRSTSTATACRSSSLPMQGALGLPMTGKIDFAFSLDLPNETNKAGSVGERLDEGRGRARRSRARRGCSIRRRQDEAQAEAQELAQPGVRRRRHRFRQGRHRLARSRRSTIKNGKLDVTKFETKSERRRAQVDFSMTLAPDARRLDRRRLPALQGHEALLKREPKTYAAIQTTGAALGPDGLFHIKLTDEFKEMKRLDHGVRRAANVPMDEMGSGTHPSDRRGRGCHRRSRRRPIDKPPAPPTPPPVPVTRDAGRPRGQRGQRGQRGPAARAEGGSAGSSEARASGDAASRPGQAVPSTRASTAPAPPTPRRRRRPPSSRSARDP